MKSNVNNEVRLTHPGLARSCDNERSRDAAIKLFCLACMGGSKQEVLKCKSYSCHLWQYRDGISSVKPPSSYLPTEEDYQKEGRSSELTEKRKAWGKELGRRRAEQLKEKKL